MINCAALLKSIDIIQMSGWFLYEVDSLTITVYYSWINHDDTKRNGQSSLVSANTFTLVDILVQSLKIAPNLSEPGLSSRLLITSMTYILTSSLDYGHLLNYFLETNLQSGPRAIWLTIITQCPWSPLTISNRCPRASDRLISRHTKPLHTGQTLYTLHTVPFRNLHNTAQHWLGLN